MKCGIGKNGGGILERKWWKEAVAYQIIPAVLWTPMGMELVIFKGLFQA